MQSHTTQFSKRIIYILPAYSKNVGKEFASIATSGGGGRYAAELAKAVSGQADATVLVFGTQDARYAAGKLKVIVHGYNSKLLPNDGKSGFHYRKLFKLLNQYDVIHAFHYYTDPTLVAAISALSSKRKLFVSDLGWRGLTVSRYFPAKYFFTAYLALTGYEQKLFKIPDKKFEVISGGVDIEKYTYHAQKHKRVMFIGRLMPHKGINYLIEALDAKTECIIAGHKSDPKYFDLLQKLATGKNVKFLLSASDEEIRDKLKSAAVLVLPSVDVDVYGVRHKNPELFGLVVAEAFACGTPAIVSDSSALPYVVKDGVTGFVVKQNDASAIRDKISYILDDSERATKMGVVARKEAENRYNWQAVANACIRSYEEK